ncbi:indole-3-glycerol phosphate synthase TrpC [Promineifilum sp.]|uniref:indole-3-glycerol phosphate synthase TrpC n=1 Tax=Promineifilum sp. TaxID=2664178 RepID=UPI0035AFBFCD
MSVTNLAKRRGEILDEIMAHHREQLPKTMQQVSLEDLRAMTAVAPPPRDFEAAVRAPGVSLIAECKKASPSKGLLVNHYDPVRLARLYEKAGARAISVLTDTRHFQGTLEHLRDVREAVRLPVLRKDFIFHPYQVYEARVAGADAILLIAAVLGDTDLSQLLALARKLGMAALVEVHSEAELARVLPLSPAIIGINNRDLQTFEVDFGNTARLRALIPADIAVVGESGLKTPDDVQAMRAAGVNAVLVGEALVRSKDVLAAARAFIAAGQPE